jgi:hypothetical protein
MGVAGEQEADARAVDGKATSVTNADSTVMQARRGC